MRRATQKVFAAIDLAAEHRLKDNLLVVLCGWSMLLGVLVLTDRLSLADVGSFRAAFRLASPTGWALLFIVVGGAPLLTFRKPRDHRATAWLLRGLVIVYAAFSILAAASYLVLAVGVLTPIIAYLLPAMLGALLAAVYESSGRRHG